VRAGKLMSRWSSSTPCATCSTAGGTPLVAHPEACSRMDIAVKGSTTGAATVEKSNPSLRGARRT